MIEHVAHKHANEAPFRCTCCDYKAGSLRQLEGHFKQKKHIKKADGIPDVGLIEKVEGVDLSGYYKQIEPNESKSEWNKRKRSTPEPEVNKKTRKEDVHTEGEEKGMDDNSKKPQLEEKQDNDKRAAKENVSRKEEVRGESTRKDVRKKGEVLEEVIERVISGRSGHETEESRERDIGGKEGDELEGVAKKDSLLENPKTRDISRKEDKITEDVTHEDAGKGKNRIGLSEGTKKKNKIRMEYHRRSVVQLIPFQNIIIHADEQGNPNTPKEISKESTDVTEPQVENHNFKKSDSVQVKDGPSPTEVPAATLEDSNRTDEHSNPDTTKGTSKEPVDATEPQVKECDFKKPESVPQTATPKDPPATLDYDLSSSESDSCSADSSDSSSTSTSRSQSPVHPNANTLLGILDEQINAKKEEIAILMKSPPVVLSPLKPRKPKEAADSPLKSSQQPTETLEDGIGDFNPDYQEQVPEEINARNVVKEAATGIREELVSSLIERPSAVAESVMVLCRQVTKTNVKLDNVADKLDELRPPRSNMGAELGSLRNSIGSLRSDINGLREQSTRGNDLLSELIGTIRNLTNVVKELPNTIEYTLQLAETRRQTQTPEQPRLATTMDQTIQRMAGEFDVNWANIEEERIEAAANRRTDGFAQTLGRSNSSQGRTPPRSAPSSARSHRQHPRRRATPSPPRHQPPRRDRQYVDAPPRVPYYRRTQRGNIRFNPAYRTPRR